LRRGKGKETVFSRSPCAGVDVGMRESGGGDKAGGGAGAGSWW